jgi:hypothetical protein
VNSPVPARYRSFVGDGALSPWKPSVRAVERVKDGLPAPTECRYCSWPVEIAHHTEVYRREYGDWPWMYRCTGCDARVGMHPFTSIPLGTLANEETREARSRAHATFDPIWKSGRMTRTAAYDLLRRILNVPAEQAHISMLDVAQCRTVVESVEFLPPA